MPIPDFQSLMGPLLTLARDGKDHSFKESQDRLAKQFAVSDEERRIMLPSGRARLFANRVGWAKTHSRMAGLIENRSRGVFRITERGIALLAEHPDKIDLRILREQPGYLEARDSKKLKNCKMNLEDAGADASQTPEEQIEAASVALRESLGQEILAKMKSASPSFFETLVVELIVRMGYGGTRKDAGKAIGRSGDEGIDGIIKEDRLGLDVIYIQAKKWESGVSRPEIHKFAGALQGRRAKKGIFITTSSFSKEAWDFALSIDSKLVLVDGDELADFMIDNGIGVAEVGKYVVKRIDSDYFSQ